MQMVALPSPVCVRLILLTNHIRGGDLRGLKVHEPVSLGISMRLGGASRRLDNTRTIANSTPTCGSYISATAIHWNLSSGGAKTIKTT